MTSITAYASSANGSAFPQYANERVASVFPEFCPEQVKNTFTPDLSTASTKFHNRGVAQGIEQEISNLSVAGSSPAAPANDPRYRMGTSKYMPGKCRRNRIARLMKDHKATCAYCGKKVRRDVSPTSDSRATIDHIIPKSEGGSHAYVNLALACYPCNKRRGIEYNKSKQK